jgi:hypothetical protein
MASVNTYTPEEELINDLTRQQQKAENKKENKQNDKENSPT